MARWRKIFEYSVFLKTVFFYLQTWTRTQIPKNIAGKVPNLLISGLFIFCQTLSSNRKQSSFRQIAGFRLFIRKNSAGFCGMSESSGTDVELGFHFFRTLLFSWISGARDFSGSGSSGKRLQVMVTSSTSITSKSVVSPSDETPSPTRTRSGEPDDKSSKLRKFRIVPTSLKKNYKAKYASLPLATSTRWVL